MPWDAATQAHSSHPQIVAAEFCLLKVIVAMAINRSNTVYLWTYLFITTKVAAN